MDSSEQKELWDACEEAGQSKWQDSDNKQQVTSNKQTQEEVQLQPVDVNLLTKVNGYCNIGIAYKEILEGKNIRFKK